MSALGWVLFAACNVVSGIIGWQIKGWVVELREWWEEKQ